MYGLMKMLSLVFCFVVIRCHAYILWISSFSFRLQSFFSLKHVDRRSVSKEIPKETLFPSLNR